jgi:hypothetical protein
MSDDNFWGETGRAIGRYFVDLVRYMPQVIISNTDNELKKTLESLDDLRQRMLAVAATDLDRTRAAEMAFMASLAYNLKAPDESSVTKLLAKGDKPLSGKYCLVNTISNPEIVAEYVEDADPRGFVAETKDEIVVSVKGSSDLFDWIVNSRFLSATSIEMQEGYALMGAWITSQLLSILTLGELRSKRIITITGHSLGGAIALVTSWLLAKAINSETPQPNVLIETYTFGSPQVGGTMKQKHPFAFDVPEYRFATAGDLVAGFGILDDSSSKYIIGNQCEVYKFDNTRDAKLVRLFEIVKSARGKKGMHDLHLRLILIKIREALTNTVPLEADVILSMEPKNFPITVWLPEHKIERYLSALVCDED